MGKSKERDLLFNTIIIGIGKFSTQIVSFLLLPLYTSILTPSEYGIYDLILTIATFLLPAITLLMEESMFRFLIDCNNDRERKGVISQTCIYATVSSIFFLSIALVINKFITIPYIYISIAYILSSIISGIRNAIVRGVGKLKLYAIINFIASLVNIILNVILIAILKWGVYGLLISGIVSNLLSSILVFWKLKIHKYVSFKLWNKDLMGKMIKYSIPLVPNSLSWTIVNLSDRFVISGIIGKDANGIYSMSYKFPNLMNTIYGFFYTAWKESSAKAVKDNDKEEFFNYIYKLLTNIMFSVSIGIIGCMPILFSIFIKEAYNESFLYIPILVISMYYNNMSGYFGGIFSGYKDTKIMGVTTIIGAIINLVVNLALINFIGIYAAAFSTLISCIVIYYYRKFKVKKYIKLEKNNRIVGILILFFTLILYYNNKNIVIKFINLIIIPIYAIIVNKTIIIQTIKPIYNKIKIK